MFGRCRNRIKTQNKAMKKESIDKVERMARISARGSSKNGWAGFLLLIHRMDGTRLLCSPQRIIAVIYNILPRAMTIVV